MRNRERALAAVRDRLSRAVSGRDPGRILTEEALGEAEELAALVDPADDIEAACVLGVLHWSRYQALPDGAGQEDRTAAVLFFAPVFQADPEAVPEPLRELYRQTRGPAPDPDGLARRAIELLTAYQRTGELPLLAAAVQAGREAVAATPVGHPDRAMLSNHGSALKLLFRQTGDSVLLDEAVKVSREAVAATPADDPNRAIFLHNLGNALQLLFRQTGDSVLLDEAVKVSREGVAAAPVGHPARPHILNSLQMALQTRYELTGDAGDASARAEAVRARQDAVAATLADPPNRADPGRAGDRTVPLELRNRQAPPEHTEDTAMTGEEAEAAEKVVQAARDALAAIPADHPDRAEYLAYVAGALLHMSESTQDNAMLAEAVQVSRDAVAAASGGHPALAGCLSDLGVALLYLSSRMGEIAALEEAARVGRDAVAATPDGDPRRGGRLFNLGNALLELSRRTGEMAVLAEAAQAFRDAVAATPAGDPERATRLIWLTAALVKLSEHDDEVAVPEEAVQAAREALALTPASHPSRAGILHNLGDALQVLSDRTRDSTAGAEAVQVLREAVAATRADGPGRAGVVGGLCSALMELSEQTGDPALSAEAAEAAREAVAAIPDGHPDRAAHLNNLGNALQQLSGHSGDPALLDEAVRALREAVAGDHPRRAARLNNLSIALRAQSRRAGDSALLDESVQAAQDAVAATPDGHPRRGRRLTSLGIALQVRSRRTDRIEAATEAVQVLRAAVAATPAGHPDRAMHLNNLGNALEALFERTGDTDLLTEAVQTFRDAVAATSAGRRDWVASLTNLGTALQVLSQRTGDTDLLDEAVQMYRAALAATSTEHPDRARGLANLGVALSALAERTGSPAALAEAGPCLRRAAESPSLGAAHRINLYCAVAGLPGYAGGSPQTALAAVEAAVGLLPQVASGALGRADREHNLGEQGALAEQAAAAAVTAGRPDRAVELLEQTRGVLIADALDARSSDLTRLRSHQPDLADEFRQLRARLDALDHPEFLPPEWTDPAGSAQNLGQARRDAQAAWDDLIARIRGTDGFADFLKPPGIRQLVSVAAGGPVIFTYASQSRCDALILTGDPAAPVQVVPLTGLTEDDARRQAAWLRSAHQFSGFHNADPAERFKAQKAILDVLAWMWETITGPVLTALGCTATPAGGQPWPRVWWCPVGSLAYLPLHAAGHHRDHAVGEPHPRTVLDRVISSYTATGRGLAYARAQQPKPATTSTLIIAVPDAPGASPLRGATAEAEALTKLIPGARSLPRPTRRTVLDALPGHAVAHFACHGYVNWDDPAASQLVLYDHQTAPLTVAAIGARQLTGSLAYLSACDTTVTSPALLNEAVHITGAFQLAGYQHVIGTHWPVSDTVAQDLAIDFYAQLTHDGTIPPDAGRAAVALHYATRQLRGRYPNAPVFWAGYTHTGI